MLWAATGTEPHILEGSKGEVVYLLLQHSDTLVSKKLKRPGLQCVH